MRKMYKFSGESKDEKNRSNVEDVTQQLDLNQINSWQNVEPKDMYKEPAPVLQNTGYFDPFADEMPDLNNSKFKDDGYFVSGDRELGSNDSFSYGLDDDDKSERRSEPRTKKSSSKKKKTKFQKFLSKLKKWVKSSTSNKVIAIAAAAVLLITVIFMIYLIASSFSGGNNNMSGNVDSNEVDDAIEDNYTFVDAGEYAGTLLETTADAGEKYVKETLFIGDSNFARMVMYGFLDYDNVIGVESMGIHGVTSSNSVYFSGYTEPVTITKAVELMQPRRIVMSFGTNNVLSNDPEGFVEAYEATLKELKKSYSHTDIIICAIPPLGENRSNKSLSQKSVDDYNLALIKMAKELGYSFLDTSEVLKGANGYIKPEYIYSDGIHISDKGFDMFFKYVRTHASSVEDTRPKPLNKMPTQVAPPKKEVEEGTEFSLELVSSGALAQFVAAGCKSGVGTTTPSSWNFVVPLDVEAGTESTWSNSVYTAYVAQKGAPTAGSSVVVSGSKNNAEFVFTVTVYPVVTCTTHTWENGKITPATCAAAGKIEQKCKICGQKQTIDDPAAPKKDHDWKAPSATWKVTTPATCGKVGIESRTCPVCKVIETQEIKATGKHTEDPTPKITAATIKTEGLKIWSCTVCKNEIRREVIPKLACSGHAWVTTTTTPPSCTAVGQITQKCSVCDLIQTITDPSNPNILPHTPKPEDVTVCSVCGNPTGQTPPPPPAT